MKRFLMFLTAVAQLSAFAAEPHPVVPLWPHGAPGSEGKTEPELIKPGNVSQIHNPSITVYLPSPNKVTGAAVVICPGGGHRVLAIDHEGYNVGQWLSEHGIAGFVLKNRLAKEPGSTYTIEGHSLPDTQRAIRLVRARAAEWGVDPARVGVMGFSAGGELAYLSAMHFDNGNEGASDPIDRQSSRPAFQALIYPGGTKNIVPATNAPPVFFACGYGDRPDISEGLAKVYLDFKKAGVSAELHIYSGVGHGFGIRASNKGPVAEWPDRFKEWLAAQGLLKNDPK